MDDRLGGWFQPQTGELAEGFDVRPADTVIDVGCGDGAGATAFLAQQGAEVLATDVDQSVLDITRRRLQNSPARAYETILSDSNPLPIDDHRASRVVCMEVMEHVPDPERFMAELVRIGQPGAKYLLTVPDPASENVQKAVAPEIYWQEPNHLRIFSHDAFSDLVEGAGLTIERRFSRGFYWSVWWAMFWSCNQEFGDPEEAPLKHWTLSWHALISTPGGKRIKDALDAQLPKSQGIIAVKKAA